jgi:ankyrin repeat protein
VGSFTVHGELIVADRCYVKSTRPDLAHRFRAKRGAWHAWSRSSSGKYRQVMLVVAAHERHLALAKKGWHRRVDVPRVGADVPVESGNVGVLDAQRLDADEVFATMVDDGYGTGEPEQLLDGSGCATHTGMGDGIYPLGVETSRGVAVAVQVGFFFDDDDDDDDDVDEEDGAKPAIPVTKAGEPRQRLGTVTAPLHAAVVDGDRRKVKQLLAEGAKVNERDRLGETAAYVAACKGNVAILRVLRDAGANLLARGEVGETALCRAAFEGYSAVVTELLAAGADPNDRAGPVRATPIHAAAMGDQAGVTQQLLAAGARIDVRDSHLYTPLMCAASRGSAEAARVLLAHGPGNDENEALLIAADEGYLDLVKLLITGGADPTYRSKYGKTALMHAQMCKHRKARAVVKFLASVTPDAPALIARTRRQSGRR